MSQRRLEVAMLLEEYTDREDLPILAEFCYQNRISRSRIYEWPELKEAHERLLLKKEAQLVRGALTGEINCPMAIFALKQIGYTDSSTTRVVHTGPNGGPIETVQVTATMTAEQATAAYLKLMRG